MTQTGTASPTRPVGGQRHEIDAEAIVESGQFGRYKVVRQLGAGGMGLVFEAIDPALQRSVALKLLRPHRYASADDAAHALAIEAQAMARLSHPNVVAVYEIDRIGAQMYVAMELVAGTTLRGWLHERPRSWREILELFVAAGRGLAAAHSAGVIHRDFKPDNLLISSDGRPRVSDFGLALEPARAEEPLSGLASGDDIASRGSAVGTPAYMSPEQWERRRIDARSDQFAFSVTLWEALCGVRPFAGSRSKAVRASILTGAVTEPSRRLAVPRGVLSIVRRGLAVDPQARWPDMTAMLDAVARRARAGRRWAIAAVAAGIALGSAGAATAVVASRAAGPCPPPTERLAAVWSPAHAARLRSQLVAVDPLQGAARLDRIAGALDAAVRGFASAHVTACSATRVEGRQSDSALDRRMGCLDRWLVELDRTAAAMSRATGPAAVDRAARAAVSLSPLDVCADGRALAEIAPPNTERDRAAAIALADRIRGLEVARRMGELDGLATAAAAVVDGARTLGHPPTLAAALALQIRVLDASGQLEVAEPILRDLAQVAARARDDRDEAFAWLGLLRLAATARSGPDDAQTLVTSARAAVVRAGEPVDLRVDLLAVQALVASGSARGNDSLASLGQAQRLLETAGASSPTSPLALRLAEIVLATGAAHLRATDPQAAIAADHQSIERWRALFGPDSSDEGRSWAELAQALRQAGRADEAQAASRQADRIRAARDARTGGTGAPSPPAR